MAIYRPPRARWPGLLAALIAGLVVGLLAGFVLGSEDPDPAEAARTARASMTRAASVLGVLEVEYTESVEGGAVVQQNEYEGARDALDRSREAYAEARPALAQLAPAQAQEIDAAYDALASLVEEPAEPDEVSAAIDSVSAMLEGE